MYVFVSCRHTHMILFQEKVEIGGEKGTEREVERDWKRLGE